MWAGPLRLEENGGIKTLKHLGGGLENRYSVEDEADPLGERSKNEGRRGKRALQGNVGSLITTNHEHPGV